MKKKHYRLIAILMALGVYVTAPGTALAAEVSEENTVIYPDEIIVTGTGDGSLAGGCEEVVAGTGGAVDTDETEAGNGGEKADAGSGYRSGESRSTSGAEDDRQAALDALSSVQAYLQNNVTEPIVGSIGGEWSVIAMARYGNLTENAKNAYLSNLYATLRETDGDLSYSKYTEYSRVTLAVTSIGVNPQNVNGYDILYPLAQLENVEFQGINGPIWALIALDSHRYEIPQLNGDDAEEYTQTTREGLIERILDWQTAEGGWALNWGENDPDMTGMAIQALTPYYDRADVKASVDKGLAWLSRIQDENGGFNGEEESTVESTAQVVTALAGLDVSLLSDESFIKNGNSAIDHLLSFRLDDGSYEHTEGGGSNLMATEQTAYTLTAYYRAVNGMNDLYDMTDVPLQEEEQEEPEENVEAFRQKLEQLPSPEEIRIKDESTVNSLYAELDSMGKFDEKDEFRKRLDELLDRIDAQKEEVELLNDKIWNNINPLKVTLDDADTIAELMAEYEAVPEENREYVTYRDDLLTADTIVSKLGQGIIGKEIFRMVTESGQDYTYDGNTYEILLSGSSTYQEEDMMAGITVEKNGEIYLFTTEAKGQLPGAVTVSMPCPLSDGEYMLYRRTEDRTILSGKASVKDGLMICTIRTGGTYSVEKDEPEELVMKGTGSTDTPLSANGNAGLKSGMVSSNAANMLRTAGSSGSAAITSNTVDAKVENNIVSKDQAEAIKDKDRNLRMTGKTADGTEYTLTLNGKDIKEIKDINIAMRTPGDYQEEIALLADSPVIYTFEHDGDFPGVMQAEVTIDKPDGEYLLFYYDEDGQRAEYIQKVEVKDKQTRFLIERGGTYFIDKRAKTASVEEIRAGEESQEITVESTEGDEPVVQGNAEQSSFPTVPVAAAVVCAAGVLLGVILFRKKKNKSESKVDGNEKND